MSAEVHVGFDGYGCYTSIQAAINALPATGGVVRIPFGTYNEHIVSNKPAVSLIGYHGQTGPNFVSGQAYTVCIQNNSGTLLDIGSAAGITDPGWNIENVTFNDASFGGASYGLRVRRMRNLTLRNVQFANFQTITGAALYLDGTSGFVEWSHLDNVWFSQCGVAQLHLNATDTNIHGGGFINPADIAGSTYISTTGVSDTLRVFGAAVLEAHYGIILNGNSNENAQIFGFRFENHAVTNGVGVDIKTTNNLVCGTFYGHFTGVKMEASSASNTLLACTYSGVQSGGSNFTDSGTSNREI